MSFKTETTWSEILENIQRERLDKYEEVKRQIEEHSND